MRLARLLWLPALVIPVACGDVPQLSDAAIDAATDDAVIDAVPDAFQPGTVNVTVLTSTLFGAAQGAPVPGATVIFTDNNGPKTTTTEGLGKASAMVASETTVTVLRQTTPNLAREFITVYGAQPGDDLVIGQPSVTIPPTLGTMKIVFPAFPLTLDPQPDPALTIADYQVFNGCNDAGVKTAGKVEADLTFFERCGNGPQEIVIVAIYSNGKLAGWTSVNNVPFKTGETFTVPSDTKWQLPGTFSAMYSGLHASTIAVITAREIVDGRKSYLPGLGSALVTIPPVQALQFPYSGFGKSMRVASYVMSISEGAKGREQFAVEYVSLTKPARSTFGTDVSMATVALLENFLYDASDRTLSWTSKSLVQEDGIALILTVTKPPAPDGSVYRYFWYLIIPPGTSKIQLPDLPNELGNIDPANASEIDIHTATVIERSGIDGYKAFRNGAPERFIIDIRNQLLIYSIGGSASLDTLGSGADEVRVSFRAQVAVTAAPTP